VLISVTIAPLAADHVTATITITKLYRYRTADGCSMSIEATESPTNRRESDVTTLFGSNYASTHGYRFCVAAGRNSTIFDIVKRHFINNLICGCHSGENTSTAHVSILKEC
jgi:hypothetical protein